MSRNLLETLLAWARLEDLLGRGEAWEEHDNGIWTATDEYIEADAEYRAAYWRTVNEDGSTEDTPR